MCIRYINHRNIFLENLDPYLKPLKNEATWHGLVTSNMGSYSISVITLIIYTKLIKNKLIIPFHMSRGIIQKEYTMPMWLMMIFLISPHSSHSPFTSFYFLTSSGICVICWLFSFVVDEKVEGYLFAYGMGYLFDIAWIIVLQTLRDIL